MRNLCRRAFMKTILKFAPHLNRLKIIEATVAYPLLIRIFDSVYQGTLKPLQLLDVLKHPGIFFDSSVRLRLSFESTSENLSTDLRHYWWTKRIFCCRVREQLGGKRCPDNKSFFDALISPAPLCDCQRGLAFVLSSNGWKNLSITKSLRT